MKLNRNLFALVFVTLAFSEANAAIGWDLQECERHFGNPLGGPFEGRHGDSHNYHFRSKSWDIWANFSDATNRVKMITYITRNKKLLEKEQSAFLQENAPGVSKWNVDAEASERLQRLQWNGSAGEDSYTAIVEHDADGNHSLTVIYNGPTR